MMNEEITTETVKYLDDTALKHMYARLNRRFKVVNALPAVSTLTPAELNLIYLYIDGEDYIPYFVNDGQWVEFGINSDEQVQADWTEDDDTLPSFVRNKPEQLLADAHVEGNDLVIEKLYGGETVEFSGMSDAEREKLEGIEDNAQVNVIETVQVAGVDLTVSEKTVNIPDATSGVKGVVKLTGDLDSVDTNAAITPAAVSSGLGTKQDNLPTTGTASDTYAINVSGSASSATYDGNGDEIFTTYATKTEMGGKQDQLPTTGTASDTYAINVTGSASSATYDGNGDEISTTYATKDAATTSTDGLMSAADKDKLDGITDYVVSASVSGRTLTLTPKNGEAVTFTETGDVNVIEGVKVGNDALVPDADKVVTVPLFNGSTNGAVTAPTSTNRNAASFLNGMGDWSMLEEVSEASIDAMFLSVTLGGREYKVIKIGNQLWMAENLDWAFQYNGEPLPVGSEGVPSTPAAWYYNNDSATYGIDGGKKCGLLYNWYAAEYLNNANYGLLPSGWHIPSQGECETAWNIIAPEGAGYGINYSAGGKLKAVDGSIISDPAWPSNWNGTDDYGFRLLPCGSRASDGVFRNLDNYGYYWSTSSGSGDTIRAMGCWFGDITISPGYFMPRNCGISIRLVKNLT